MNKENAVFVFCIAFYNFTIESILINSVKE